MAVRISALRAGRPFFPRRFVVLVVERLSQLQGYNMIGRIKSIEKFDDLKGNCSNFDS
jgi:hypothetical protein